MTFAHAEPDAYDLSSVSPGDALDASAYAYLHDFFEEEGMALHLRTRAKGCAFYVNLPPDYLADIVRLGVDSAQLVALGDSSGLNLILHSGTGPDGLNLPFVFDFSSVDHLQQLLGLARPEPSELFLLAGTTGTLTYCGAVAVQLPDGLRSELSDIAGAILEVAGVE